MNPAGKAPPIDVARLRALCDAATPGLWEARCAVQAAPPHVVAKTLDTQGRRLIDFVAPHIQSPADAAFIAEMRTGAPAMLDEIVCLRAELTGIEPDNATVDTYSMPAHGWTCFHCGKTFMSPEGARRHFGDKPDSNDKLRAELAEIKDHAHALAQEALECAGDLAAERRKVERVRTLHVPDSERIGCVECEEPWPCGTDCALADESEAT